MGRGCGDRIAGGVYLEVPLSPFGLPLEQFITDPPMPIPPNSEHALGLSDRGIHYVPRETPTGTVYDALDIVGREHYPNVADVLEEIRTMGVSRRVAADDGLAKLSGESRLVLLHRRAVITNADDVAKAIREEQKAYPNAQRQSCPKTIEDHERWLDGVRGVDIFTHCAALWWEDVDGGTVSMNPEDPPRTVSRMVGDTTYRARHTPERTGIAGVLPNTYMLGIFAVFPIPRLAVIRDAESGRHNAAMAKAKKAGIPAQLEDA